MNHNTYFVVLLFTDEILLTQISQYVLEFIFFSQIFLVAEIAGFPKVGVASDCKCWLSSGINQCLCHMAR